MKSAKGHVHTQYTVKARFGSVKPTKYVNLLAPFYNSLGLDPKTTSDYERWEFLTVVEARKRRQ